MMFVTLTGMQNNEPVPNPKIESLLIYRAMIVDPTDGKPMVGIRRGMLGVRPTDPTNTIRGRQFDVPAVVGSDSVSPGRCQGLSANLAYSNIQAGPKDEIWQLEIAILARFELIAEIDPTDSDHIVIAPVAVTTLEVFQNALQFTRDFWNRLQ